jgi:membrane associated rhomboid family serine protease
MARRVSTTKLVLRWTGLTLGVSIVGALDGGWLSRWTALVPSRVWHGEVWRLISWPWILTDCGPLLMTLAVIYRFGGDLAEQWGELRLRRFIVHILIGAGLGTCALESLLGGYQLVRLGGLVASDVLVIAWARQFPERPLVLCGLPTMSGRDLVRFTVGSAILFAVVDGPLYRAPELLACLAAAVYPRSWLRGLNAR